MVAETSGWGLTDDEKTEGRLHSITMTIMKIEDCIKSLEEIKSWNSTQRTDNIICAIDYENKSTVTSGDSGGFFKILF